MEAAKFALWGNKFLNFTKELGTKIADGAVYAAKKTKEGAIFVGNKTKEGAIFVGNKTKEGAHFIAEKTKPATEKIKKAHGKLKRKKLRKKLKNRCARHSNFPLYK